MEKFRKEALEFFNNLNDKEFTELLETEYIRELENKKQKYEEVLRKIWMLSLNKQIEKITDEEYVELSDFFLKMIDELGIIEPEEVDLVNGYDEYETGQYDYKKNKYGWM